MKNNKEENEENMLMILNLIEKFDYMQFLIYSGVFAIIMALIDINVIMRWLRITSKNHAKLKICAIDIFLSILLLKTFLVLTEDLIGRKFLVCNFSFMFLTIICKILICMLNDKLKLLSNINQNNNKMIIYATIVISIFFMIFDSAILKAIKDDNYFKYAFADIAIMIYIYSNLEYLIWIKNMQKQNIKLHVLESQNKNLTVMYDNMRGFRHDFSNFIQALDGYVKTNDIEGVKLMCESITRDYKNVNNMEIIGTNVLNNSAVGCILTNKYFIAQQENINVNIECLIDLAETKEYSYEFCRILAILLDNAIEAAKQSDEKLINIKIFKDVQVNRKLIIIENTYNQVDIDLDKIFEKGYSSKEDSGNAHGLGLWTVRKTLNKCNKLNLFTTKDDMFRQQLEIYQ